MKGTDFSRDSGSRYHAPIRWVIAAVSLVLPLLFSGTLADPFQLPKQVLFRWGALAVLGLWLLGTLASGRGSLRRSGATAPLLLLMFIGLLSVFQAPNPAESSSAIRDMAFCAMVFFLSLSALEEGTGFVAGSIGLGAALTAALGASQILFGPRVGFLPPTQGGALVGDVSTGAIFVAITLPLLLGLTTSRSRGAWFWAAGTGVSLAYVALARTRAAWLGAGAGLILFAILSLLRRRSRETGPAPGSSGPRRLMAGAIALAVALCLAGTFGRGIDLLSSPPSMKTVELQGLELRLSTWQATLRMVLSRPLGVGAGSWRRAFPEEAGKPASASHFTSSRLPQSAGNLYLEMAAELGPAGLFLLLWFLVRAISTGWKRSAAGGGVRTGAAVSLASIAGCGLLASPFAEQPSLWTATILAALVLAPGRETEPAGSQALSWEMDPRRRRLMGLLAGLLFATLVGISAWSGYRAFVSSASLQSGQAACLRRDYATALPSLQRAAGMDPSSGLVRYLTGACALASGQLGLAETELRAAHRLNPQDAATLLALASALQATGDLTGALGACEKARKIWPKDEAVNLALGDIRGAAGDVKGSLDAYRAALEGNPYSVRAYLKIAGLMEGQNQPANAASAYSRAVTLDPYSPEALAGLGDAYMKQGNYESAVEVYNNLLAIVPDHFRALVNLARTLAGMQRSCEALPILEKARGLDRDPSRRAQIDQAIADLNAKCQKTRPQVR